MILSMAAIGAVVGTIYVVLPRDEDKDPTRVVDYRIELVTAQRAAPYPVLAPQGLDKGWRATSVEYDRMAANAWHLGFLDPDREYVAVEQSTGPSAKFIAKVTHDAADTGKTRQVAGETWQRWEGPKYDALVRVEKGATTVVTGTAPLERLTEMAEALEAPRPQPAPSS